MKEEIERTKIITLGKKIPKAGLLINYLYSNPVVSSDDVSRYLKITRATANSLINDFIKLEILKELTGGKRNRLYSFYEYLNLFRN
ncbi:hypothetical protein ACFLTH_08910 [Bacteroidota bacterium]